MKNKTVVRRPNKAGEFTTIHNSILYDTRLSALELRILISILSDADTFNLTQNLLLNRFGIEKKTLQKAFKGLESCGYIKRTELKRGHYYTISEYGNLSSKEETSLEPIQEQIPLPAEEKQVPVDQIIVKPLDLAHYNDLIVSLLPTHATDDNIMDLMMHLVEAVNDGRLSKPEEMTPDNLKKIISKIIPTPKTDDINKNITKLCDIYAGGRQITISNKNEITAKVIKYFKENSDVEPNEMAIRKRIRMYKTSYTSSGHLDQRYQN